MPDPLDELTPGGPRWPLRLDELPDRPDRLWLAGAIPEGPLVAIVGTRRADPGGLEIARALARDLGALGISTISGGAAGIDAAAHRGALDAGALTWVVQAAPLDEPYPRTHRPLFDAILDAGGGWLSETPPGAYPKPWRFLARNRLIAALADAVVVVQAPHKSGAMSTARWAARLGRPLLAVPARPGDPRGAGCLTLLDDGASLCLGAASVTRALARLEETADEHAPGDADSPAEDDGARGRARVATRAHVAHAPPDLPDAPPDLPPDLPEELREVHAALGPRAVHLDALVERTGLSASRLSVALVRLAALGRAHQDTAGWRLVALAR